MEPKSSFEKYQYQCSKGWWPIIDQAIEAMRATGWKGPIDQVKEKFGGLRLYWSFDESELEQGSPKDSDLYQELKAIVAAAEEKCWRTCEECGSVEDVKTGPGPVNKYWIRTLCGKCRT